MANVFAKTNNQQQQPLQHQSQLNSSSTLKSHEFPSTTPPMKLIPPPPISPNQHIRTSTFAYNSPPKKSSTSFSKLYSSPKSITSLSSSNSISSHQSSLNDEKLIKTLLKRYKKLESSLNKFNSKKYNNHSQNVSLKSNLLRTSLLPFLRSTNHLVQLFNLENQVYKSLANVLSSILYKWWKSLLTNLNFENIPSSDRNAYLECISRIIGRNEHENIDDLQLEYQNLLIQTLEYCIEKMSNLKNNSLSFSAFVGKVFAYSFFKLPNVSNALLFLLNVKQITFETTMKKLNYNFNSSNSFWFPSHLQYLSNYRGIKLSIKGQKCFMNCMQPPKHPVNGIKDPNGDWVRRWSCSDSNVFNSFLRHYITILYKYEVTNLVDCPGFSIIISHILQIFQNAITKITTQPKNSSGNYPNENVYFNSIMKIFKTVRDVIYCGSLNQNPSICRLNADLVSILDLCLINIAKNCSIYESQTSNIILSIFNEFINHVDNNLIEDNEYLINWQFWLNCNFVILTHSNHIQTLIKSFAFLFNCWDMIPDFSLPGDTESFSWVKDGHSSFKTNFTNYLISDSNLIKYLTHWNPLVRSYYIKLIIWRVLGINNYQNSNSIQLTKLMQLKFNLIYNMVEQFTSENQNRFRFNFKPDNPLVNRKFQILLINSKDEFAIYLPTNGSKSSELRKIHPYEVFDEAIYTCSTIQPMNDDEEDEDNEGVKKSTSSNNTNLLASSIGKLFRILSIEDSSSKQAKQQEQSSKIELTRNSKSLTSLASSSSTPSIMSFTSTPTSITESDNDLDLDSMLSIDFKQQQQSSIQPPELNNLPPPIIRPIYKFDIVVCHESMNEKLQLTRNIKRQSQLWFPQMVKIPIISIYNQNLYISEEDDELGEDQAEILQEAISLGDSQFVNLGKSLNEINNSIEEIKLFLRNKVEQEKYLHLMDGDNTPDDEFVYFRKLVPFLSVDSIDSKFVLD